MIRIGRGGAGAVALWFWLCAVGAAAEAAWVRGAPLNLRSGPGTGFRIIASAKPGDRIDVLQRGDGWTKVRLPSGKEGFIAAGFLDAQPPPTVRLGQLEDELSTLTSQLEETSSEAATLRTRSDTLASSDADQKARIDELTQENYKLRAGERWAEWIIGALLLGTGMALGAILRGLSGRRRSNRLRL